MYFSMTHVEVFLDDIAELLEMILEVQGVFHLGDECCENHCFVVQESFKISCCNREGGEATLSS